MEVRLEGPPQALAGEVRERRGRTDLGPQLQTRTARARCVVLRMVMGKDDLSSAFHRAQSFDNDSVSVLG